jgi:hypothetical protein
LNAPRPPISNVEHALADAEHRARVAEADLAYLARDTEGVLQAAQQRLDALARELDHANAESEQRGAALAALRRECEGVHGRLPALEQAARAVLELGERQRRELAEQRRVHDLVDARLVAERESVALIAERLASERAAANVRLVQVQEQAAAAIRSADAAANARLAQANEQAAAAIRSAQERASDALRGALETVHRLADPTETELLLRADLELAASETVALRTRLGACEHALHVRDRELQRERAIADEATRWASRVERELVLDAPPVTSGADLAAQPAAAGPPISPLRRRGPRVRLRPVS